MGASDEDLLVVPHVKEIQTEVRVHEANECARKVNVILCLLCLWL